MSISIRPCVAQDAQALALVGGATFLETFAGVLPGADIVAHCQSQHVAALYAAWLARPDHRLWLAELSPGAAPVGYLALTPPDLPVETGPDDLEVKRIYLLQRFQGQGAGAALMRTAVAEAARSGARRLLLGVYAGNAGAIAFYRRQGFVQVGVRQFRVGAGLYDDLVLARPA